jgi:hypothetical protein
MATLKERISPTTPEPAHTLCWRHCASFDETYIHDPLTASRGIRSFSVELCAVHLDCLVRKGFLAADTRNDPREIQVALCDFIEDTLVQS